MKTVTLRALRRDASLLDAAAETIIATAADLDMTLITTDSAIRDARACKVEFYPFRRRPTSKR